MKFWLKELALYATITISVLLVVVMMVVVAEKWLEGTMPNPAATNECSQDHCLIPPLVIEKGD